MSEIVATANNDYSSKGDLIEWINDSLKVSSYSSYPSLVLPVVLGGSQGVPLATVDSTLLPSRARELVSVFISCPGDCGYPLNKFH